MATYNPEVFQLKNGRKLTIRHCTVADTPLFAPFQKQISRETTHTMQMESNPPSEAQVRENWQRSELDPKALRIGAFSEGRMVGMLGFHPLPAHPWTDHLAQFGMMILKEYWGQGLGTRLLQIMESHAKKVGVSRIEAMVRIGNDRGEHLYKKNGFVIEGTRKKAAFINGTFWDEYFIAKLL